jgi:hypothetical protein
LWLLVIGSDTVAYDGAERDQLVAVPQHGVDPSEGVLVVVLGVRLVGRERLVEQVTHTPT